MDFDLFENDEDDYDILNSVLLEEPTQVPVAHLAQNILPEFNCVGEVAPNAQFSLEGFIKNCFINNNENNDIGTENKIVINELTLTFYEFQQQQLHGRRTLDFIFAEICKNVQYLATTINNKSIGGNFSAEQSIYNRRRQVTQLLHLIYHTTNNTQWQFLREPLTKLRNLINRITSLDTWKRIYMANSIKGNECNIPAYHLLHGALEWKLLDLCILKKFETTTNAVNVWSTLPLPINIDDEQNQNNSNANATANKCDALLCTQLQHIFDELIACSIFLFSKKRTVELLGSSPFPCLCFKEFWLLLQIALEKWNFDNEELKFWTLCNKTLTKLKTNLDYYALNPLKYYVFCNWLINSLVRLFGYRSNGKNEGPTYSRATNMTTAENYEFVENCTQQFLNMNPSEEYLRIYICYLTPTLLDWWSPKVNLPLLFWEYFHKHLNSSFYIAGTEPSNLAVSCATGRAYIEKYQTLLMKQQTITADAHLSSYTLFTLLLGKTLERLLDAHANGNAHAHGHLQGNNNQQALKLLGRIYSKFSLQKFFSLNETGIHHLLELFIILLLCGDFNDLAPKLREKLLNISLEKLQIVKRQIAVTKGHMALLILHAKHKYDLTEYVTKILQQLTSIRNDLEVSKVIADALLDVLCYSDDFRRGEHLLIDAWLPNFLNSCTPVEQDRTLEALHLIFTKIQDCELFGNTNEALIKSLNTYILPFIKQQFMTSFSVWLPQLAADFCILAYGTNGTWAVASGAGVAVDNQQQNFIKLFQYFVETQSANRQALPQFLLKILETERGIKLESSIVIQIWLKSLVLLTAFNEEVINLTKIVVELEEFKLICDLDPLELLKAKEPLCNFIAAVGKNYDNCSNDYEKRCKINDHFNNYLLNFEKWLNVDLKNEKTELLFRFYSFLAIVIYNCPQIVYTKSKMTCFFHIAITRFILPTTLKMGKTPPSNLVQLIHKVWPVLVQGIGKLNFRTDSYVSKTLNDLIQIWTPNFKISTNTRIVARPYINCIQSENTDLSLYVFEKVTSIFLGTQRRQADPNACLIVTIFREIVDTLTNEKHLEIFMKAVCLVTLEHIMMVDDMVPSRNLLLEFYRRLTNCAVYKKSKDPMKLMAEFLRIITKKHLAYFTFFYFELLQKLMLISYEPIEEIMDFLNEEVQIVEQKRGAGEDQRIRTCLKKLQQSLNAIKQKNQQKTNN